MWVGPRSLTSARRGEDCAWSEVVQDASRSCQTRPRNSSVPPAPAIQSDGSRDKSRVQLSVCSVEGQSHSGQVCSLSTCSVLGKPGRDHVSNQGAELGDRGGWTPCGLISWFQENAQQRRSRCVLAAARPCRSPLCGKKRGQVPFLLTGEAGAFRFRRCQEDHALLPAEWCFTS